MVGLFGLLRRGEICEEDERAKIESLTESAQNSPHFRGATKPLRKLKKLMERSPRADQYDLGIIERILAQKLIEEIKNESPKSIDCQAPKGRDSLEHQLDHRLNQRYFTFSDGRKPLIDRQRTREIVLSGVYKNMLLALAEEAHLNPLVKQHAAKGEKVHEGGPSLRLAIQSQLRFNKNLRHNLVPVAMDYGAVFSRYVAAVAEPEVPVFLVERDGDGREEPVVTHRVMYMRTIDRTVGVLHRSLDEIPDQTIASDAYRHEFDVSVEELSAYVESATYLADDQRDQLRAASQGFVERKDAIFEGQREAITTLSGKLYSRFEAADEGEQNETFREYAQLAMQYQEMLDVEDVNDQLYDAFRNAESLEFAVLAFNTFFGHVLEHSKELGVEFGPQHGYLNVARHKLAEFDARLVEQKGITYIVDSEQTGHQTVLQRGTTPPMH